MTFIDTYILKFIGKPQSGWISINKDTNSTLNRFDFLHAITTSKAALSSITLIPGETSYYFLREIANSYNLNINDVENAYFQLSPLNDGIIFPDTYDLPLANAEFLIKYLIDISLKKHKKLSIELLGHYDEKEWFKIITKASIIQKESANKFEMPLVSSVINNRLLKSMPLQMDGSLNYGIYSHLRVTSERIKNDLSSFNTYKFIGLPKEPVSSVSIEAIKAAINPAKTDYLYFMKNKDGVHDFSKTYKEHLKYVSKLKNIKNRNIK